MAPPSYPYERFTCYVFSSDLAAARKLAKERSVSVAVILRDAIKAGLEATKEKK